MKKKTKVEAMPLSSPVELSDIGPKSALWKNAVLHGFDASGKIYRITPPVDADDGVVDRLRKLLLEAGALAVRIGPRRRSGVIAPEEKKEDKPRRTARQIVLQMVEDSHVEDEEGLRKTVEETMGRVGL